MTYEEFMNKPLRLKSRVAHRADEVAFKLEVCLKATASLGGERVQTSYDNSTEKNLVRYLDSKRSLDDLIGRYEQAKEEVREFLYGCLDFEDADLLEWRYINGKDLPEIAEIVGVAYQTAKNRMGVAERNAREKFGTVRY